MYNIDDKLFELPKNERDQMMHNATNNNIYLYQNRKRRRRKTSQIDDVYIFSGGSIEDEPEINIILSQFDDDQQDVNDDFLSDQDEQASTASVSGAINRLRHKKKTGQSLRYDKYFYKYGTLNTESQSVLDRAVEYMQLYLMRYENGQIRKDLTRRMIFNARLFGAPLRRLEITPYVRKNVFLETFQVPVLYDRPINIRYFFNAMDILEQRVGYRCWDLFYISGEHFLNRKESGQMNFFRYQLISVVRKLHKAAMHRDWSAAAECIVKISLWPYYGQQQHSRVHFEFLSRTMGPYLPSIFLMALQCLLETRLPIQQITKQFSQIVFAFQKTSSQQQLWRDQRLFYHSHLLLFYLLNFHLEFPSDTCMIYASLQGVPERRRMILLLNYCIDVERNLLQLFHKNQHLQDRSLAHYFPNFLATLFEEPRDAMGLMPLAVWGSNQFDCIEELTDYLLEACTNYPYLLLNVYNVLSRFHLEHIVGQLLGQLFDMSIELLSTAGFLLDLIEQRSLDPANFGQFDDVINGNLRAVFMFLDYGRNRADQRAWALLYTNLCYIRNNGELMNAFVLPLWERRQSWWPQFHNKERVALLTREGAKMRKRVFRLLKNYFG